MLNKQNKNNQGCIIVLSGPSGAGKTTLHDLILKDVLFKNKIVRSISATTRQPRGKEKQSVDYLFLSKKMFEYKIKQKHFLEWAKVFDHYYGTPFKNVKKILKQGKHVLLCIDVQGGAEIKKKIPESVLIFIKTTSLKELKRRLENRNTDSKESVALRLKTAEKELASEKKYDHILINDVLEKTYQALKEVLKKKLKID